MQSGVNSIYFFQSIVNFIFFFFQGHWIGDPCEFGLLHVHVLPTEDCRQFKEIGEKHFRTAEISCGLAAGFGSCLSQAYNQGTLGTVCFSTIISERWPVLVSQCAATSENEFRFLPIPHFV